MVFRSHLGEQRSFEILENRSHCISLRIQLYFQHEFALEKGLLVCTEALVDRHLGLRCIVYTMGIEPISSGVKFLPDLEAQQPQVKQRVKSGFKDVSDRARTLV